MKQGRGQSNFQDRAFQADAVEWSAAPLKRIGLGALTAADGAGTTLTNPTEADLGGPGVNQAPWYSLVIEWDTSDPYATISFDGNVIMRFPEGQSVFEVPRIYAADLDNLPAVNITSSDAGGTPFRAHWAIPSLNFP